MCHARKGLPLDSRYYLTLNFKGLMGLRHKAGILPSDNILSISPGKNVPVDTHFTSKSLIIARL
jgi:hypothetical protein